MGVAHKSREELLADVERLRERNAALHARYSGGFRMLLEKLPVMLWTTDADFLCRSWAGGALKRLDLDPDQLVGQSMYDYFGTEDPDYPPVRAHHRAILGEPSDYEFEFSGLVALCHVEPLHEDGEITGVIGVGLDVTERAHADAERERLLAELRDASAVLRGGELVRICSGCQCVHEEDGWIPVERFVEERIGARLSHGLCAECARSARRPPPRDAQS